VILCTLYVCNAGPAKTFFTTQMMKISLEVVSPTQASVEIINQSTGKEFTTTVNQTNPICKKTAEWIVERGYTLTGLLGLLDFGTETFSDITYTAGGAVHNTIPDDVILDEIANDEANGTIQTSTSYKDDTVSITYLST
jgi:hypothetical protein